jgi:hypothetical protein
MGTMNSRWMNWKPKKFDDSGNNNPPKPTEPDFSESRLSSELPLTKPPEPLEAVLRGNAIELWRKDETFFLVADQEDAMRLGEPRGAVYTAAEARWVITITDPDLVAEVQRYKRTFNATIREVVGNPATQPKGKG